MIEKVQFYLLPLSSDHNHHPASGSSSWDATRKGNRDRASQDGSSSSSSSWNKRAAYILQEKEGGLWEERVDVRILSLFLSHGKWWGSECARFLTHPPNSSLPSSSSFLETLWGFISSPSSSSSHFIDILSIFSFFPPPSAGFPQATCVFFFLFSCVQIFISLTLEQEWGREGEREKPWLLLLLVAFTSKKINVPSSFFLLLIFLLATPSLRPTPLASYYYCGWIPSFFLVRERERLTKYVKHEIFFHKLYINQYTLSSSLIRFIKRNRGRHGGDMKLYVISFQ